MSSRWHDPTTVYDFRIPVKNTGLTPAYNVITRSEMTLLPAASDSSAISPVLPPEEDKAGPALGAGETLEVPCSSAPMGKVEIRWLHEDKDWALFLVGGVWYRDAFGHRRETRYCERVVWQPGRAEVFTVAIGGENNRAI